MFINTILFPIILVRVFRLGVNMAEFTSRLPLSVRVLSMNTRDTGSNRQEYK